MQEMQETQALSLGREDAMEQEIMAHCSNLGNLIDRGAWRSSVQGVKKESDTSKHVDMNS